ncbi:unnamed protein product [Penicillium bialowiezense]
MASTSHSGVNYGTQVGINNGSITANFYSELTVVRSLARSLHRSLATSLDPFQQVQNELALLVAGLEIAHSPSSLDESEVSASMTDELRGCRDNLNTLRKMKVDYDSRDSEAPENGNLEKIVEELAMIRLQLSHFTTTLGFINTNRIRISQEHVVKMLQKFISDGDSRSKAKTIISSLSNSNEEQEGWRQLQKELQDTGISPESFSENLDLIIAIFRKSFEADMPDLDTLTRYMIESPGISDRHQSDRRPASTLSNTSRTTKRPASIWQMGLSQPMNAMIKALGGKNEASNDPLPLAKPKPLDLISCAKKGDLEAVMQRLNEGSNVNASNESGDSALSLAALAGHQDVVLLLFAKGAKVGAMNHKRESALVQAAKHGRTEVLSILMSHEEPIDDSQYEKALGAAAEKGHVETVRLLLERGVDPNYRDQNDEEFNTPLFKAAGKGHEKIVRLLLDHGAERNTLSFWGESAMFAACRSNRQRIARLLLKFGATFDEKAQNKAFSHSGLWEVLTEDEDMRDRRR